MAGVVTHKVVVTAVTEKVCPAIGVPIALGMLWESLVVGLVVASSRSLVRYQVVCILLL
jgi:hypothetical protein